MMKTQLAALVLLFNGASAHSLRGIQIHSLNRYLKSGRGEKKDKYYSDNDSYRIINGKKGFRDNNSYVIGFDDEEPPILWMVAKDGDSSKVGKCVSAISEWVLDNYSMDLAVVDKEPKDDRLERSDIVVFIDKKTYASDCQDIADQLANDSSFKSRKRGGVNDSGQQNLAVFDIDIEDKKCDRDCKRDCKDKVDEDARKECEKKERECKKDCEQDCEDDCDDHWSGIFNDSCRRSC